MDGADRCRLREQMSGPDEAAGSAAAPGHFLTRDLWRAAPPTEAPAHGPPYTAGIGAPDLVSPPPTCRPTPAREF